jgi:hypothetical protein
VINENIPGEDHRVSAWVKRLSGKAEIIAFPAAWGKAFMRQADESSHG